MQKLRDWHTFRVTEGYIRRMSHESHADSTPCQPAVSRALLPHQGHLRGHGNSSKPAAPADGMWSIECSSHAAGAQYNITAYRGHNGDEVVMWSWGKNTEKDGETFASGTSVLWNLVKPRNIEMLKESWGRHSAWFPMCRQWWVVFDIGAPKSGPGRAWPDLTQWRHQISAWPTRQSCWRR